jgi:hypothetical protein
MCLAFEKPLSGCHGKDQGQCFDLSNTEKRTDNVHTLLVDNSLERQELMTARPIGERRDTIHGWNTETRGGQFEIGVDTSEKHSGTRSAFLKSIIPVPRGFGDLSQRFQASDYLGKRLRMSAWVKTKITSGWAALWLRIDGDWTDTKPGCFDNMYDRPITGATEWTRYSLVVDVPEKSKYVVFGCFLNGIGQVWVDDVSFDAVSTNVPLTGPYAVDRRTPINLNFEEHQ